LIGKESKLQIIYFFPNSIEPAGKEGRGALAVSKEKIQKSRIMSEEKSFIICC